MTPTESVCIVVYYPCGAGGKFIINSLGLSKHCVPHDSKFAAWDIQQHTFDQAYYQTKLDQMLNTIPPDEELDNWQKYELGTGRSWVGLDATIQEELNNIIDSNRHFCITAHDPEYLELLLTKYPNIKNIIKLTNYTKWMEQSSFKVPGLVSDIKNKIAHWGYTDAREITQSTIPYKLIDMDGNIYNHNDMLAQIKTLYEVLHFDDFQPELWSQYYKKYIRAIH